MPYPQALVYAEAREESTRVMEETGPIENQPYECLSPSEHQWDDQFATCSISVTYSYESTILIDQSEQNAFPQTAAGEASSVVETESQLTLTSPSIVPPNRDTDVRGPAERNHSLQKNILPTTKGPPLVHFYEDKDALNPFEGSAAHPRHILLTPSPLKLIPSKREYFSITPSHNRPIPCPGLSPHSHNHAKFTRFHAHAQQPIFIHLGLIHRNVFSLIPDRPNNRYRKWISCRSVCVGLHQFSPHAKCFRTCLHPLISLNLQGGEVLCGQSGLLGLEECAALGRARP